jgi:hypothetical protein
VSHPDDETLALLALGEPGAEADHVASCPRCQSRVDQLAAVVATARTLTPEDYPVAPPASVWAGITRELGTDTVVTPLPSQPRSRRGRLWLVGSVAAAAGLVVGALGVSAVTARDDVAPADVVARADLAPMSPAGLAGTALVERGERGNVLVVDVPDLPEVDGYYEVWMASPDASTMVSVGTLIPGTTATLALPAGLDPTAFPVVDISEEHFDGDTGHSSLSIVRGQLQA